MTMVFTIPQQVNLAGIIKLKHLLYMNAKNLEYTDAATIKFALSKVETMQAESHSII